MQIYRLIEIVSIKKVVSSTSHVSGRWYFHILVSWVVSWEFCPQNAWPWWFRLFIWRVWTHSWQPKVNTWYESTNILDYCPIFFAERNIRWARLPGFARIVFLHQNCINRKFLSSNKRARCRTRQHFSITLAGTISELHLWLRQELRSWILPLCVLE